MDAWTIALFVLLAGAAVCAAAAWSWPRWKRRHGRRERALFEDALKHILTLRNEGREAGIDSLAGSLALTQQAALRLIVRMEAAGVVRTDAGRVRLTEPGEKWAIQVVRAHRLWETYLAQEARMPMEKVHGAADREEHRLTASEAVDALDAYLGHPRSDPHGDPIPTQSGELPRIEARPLTDWPIGVLAEVIHIEDEPRSIMDRISAGGLRPGSVITVREQTPERLTLSDGARDYRLSPLEAGNVQVGPAPGTAGEREELGRLSDLRPGDDAEIVRIEPEIRGFTRRRLLDLGLTSKARVTVHLTNAFGDPMAFRVRGTTIALRREEASKIRVRRFGG